MLESHQDTVTVPAFVKINDTKRASVGFSVGGFIYFPVQGLYEVGRKGFCFIIFLQELFVLPFCF